MDGATVAEPAEFWFDPGRGEEVLSLLREAYAGSRLGSFEPREVAERALGLTGASASSLGREGLVALAASAIAAAGADLERLGDNAAARDNERGRGRAVLPPVLTEFPWRMVVSPGVGEPGVEWALRNGALQALEVVTVAWPPPGAARVWHPPRERTLAEAREIAARALAGPEHLDPGELLALETEEEAQGRIPEDALSDALRAIHLMSASGVPFALDGVIRALAELIGAVSGDNGVSFESAVGAAAETIDGAGFAGGAKADVSELIDAVVVELIQFPSVLGRLAREPERYVGSADVTGAPADAARRAIVARWVWDRRARV